MPGYLEAYVDRMAATAERLHHVSLECRPALDLIEAYGRRRNICLYVDPPYLGATRSSGSYQVEMQDDTAHRDLLSALTECRASVVLSGYASDLYDTALAGWDRLEIPTITGQGGSRQDRTEVLWSNRPFPTAIGGNETLPFAGIGNETPVADLIVRCGHCDRPISTPAATGRPRRFCSTACRVGAHRRTRPAITS
ncbi:hypothetical protein [Williamsia sterculiae]|uniref:hypothetical protein n=1 Tax=Williamsia sterculiae TaxID=1344003 RepID=UPI000970742D|nr:hypothetical protein [Williamsia sterculiae]